MSINDERGCSVCQPGKENYEHFTTRLRGKSVRRTQYDYRTPDGELFACDGVDLDDCRKKRDEWLRRREGKKG